MRVRSEITHVIPYDMRLLDAFINDRAQHRTNSPPQNACWLVCGTVCRLWRAVAEPACRPDARRRLPKTSAIRVADRRCRPAGCRGRAGACSSSIGTYGALSRGGVTGD